MTTNDSLPEYPARPEGLTDVQNRHLDVVDYVFQRYTQAAAYRKVYPSSSHEAAQSSASDIMKLAHVKEYKARVQRWVEARARVEAWEVVGELRAIAYGRPDAVMDWDSNGVRLKSSDQLSVDEAAQISSITASTRVTEDGEEFSTQKVSFHSKPQALKALADLAGLTSDFNQAIKVLHSYGVILKLDESGLVTGVEDLRAKREG